MNIKKLAVEFGAVFAVALVVVSGVTFLWSIIDHGENSVVWETSFRYTIIFAIILTWMKSRESK
jgi:hypothetical protein